MSEQKLIDLGDKAKRTLDSEAFLVACDRLLDQHAAIEEKALDGDNEGVSILEIEKRIVYRAMMRRAVQDIKTQLNIMVWDAELHLNDQTEDN